MKPLKIYIYIKYILKLWISKIKYGVKNVWNEIMNNKESQFSILVRQDE